MATPAAPSQAPSRSPTRVLRHRNYRLLWMGSVGATLGASIGNVIINWVVYSATHNPLAITALGVVGFLPTLTFGIYAGALIDRWDRRRLMVNCNIGRAVSYGGLAVSVLVIGVNLPVVLVCIFATATLGTLSRPASNALLPRLLPSQDMTDGNGLLQAGQTAAGFVGSPLGGVVLVVGAALVGAQAGPSLGLGINGATEALAGALIALMVISPRGSGEPKKERESGSLTSDVREGMRFLRTQEALLTITLLAMVANFFISMFNAYEVVYVVDRLHLGATAFGALLAAATLGFGIGGLLPGRLGADRAPGIWAGAGWGAAGLPIIVLALTASFVPALLSLFAWSCLLSVGQTAWLSAAQRTVPDKFLGRYFALDEAGSFAMIPAGQVVGGLTILAFGVSRSFLIAGLGASISSFAMLASPAVRAWARSVKPSTSA